MHQAEAVEVMMEVPGPLQRAERETINLQSRLEACFRREDIPLSDTLTVFDERAIMADDVPNPTSVTSSSQMLGDFIRTCRSVFLQT
jgi:hypothetical protein